VCYNSNMNYYQYTAEKTDYSTLWLLVQKQTILTRRLPLSVQLIPIVAGRGCRVLTAKIPTDDDFGFLDWSHYISFK
jgi:hypothetical protein